MIPVRPLRGIAVALLFSVAAAAPGHAVDPDEVQQAIEQGVLFLKHGQLDDGTWMTGHKVGSTALIAVTLLECDVEAADPAVQRAAAAVRRGTDDEGQTYDIALAIIFLDRLGEKQDEPLIATLSKRLLLGQNREGGWSYHCPIKVDTVSPGQAETLRGQKEPPKQGDVGEGRMPTQRPANPQPQQGQGLALGMTPSHPHIAQINTGDNSNTQFALLALWVAQRHNLKVDAALLAVGQRFYGTQEADGGWSYTGTSGTSPAMTCSGLLGLAVAYGVANHAAAGKPPADGSDRKESKKASSRKPRGPRDPNGDPVVRAGLVALGTQINGRFVDAHRTWSEGPPPNFAGVQPRPDMPNRPVPPIGDRVDTTDYYFLWSMERVAMAYGLKTIGRKDWYEWGAAILLAHRRPNNGWRGGYDPKIDTSFALLFLRRSNLVSDLSSSLRGKVNDPSEVKLRAGGDINADLGNRDAARQGHAKKQARKDPNAPLSSDPEADRLAREILKASAAAQQNLIDDLRDSKGAVNTVALAVVIPHLSGPAHQKARDALVMRLTRMTSSTLRDKLQDDDLEIRRAAALAVAMKEEKTLIPDLIALLEDAEAPVAKAAQAALKALTKQDFGPDASASEDDRARAIARWKDWWGKRK